MAIEHPGSKATYETPGVPHDVHMVKTARADEYGIRNSGPDGNWVGSRRRLAVDGRHAKRIRNSWRTGSNHANAQGGYIPASTYHAFDVSHLNLHQCRPQRCPEIVAGMLILSSTRAILPEGANLKGNEP